MAEYEADLSMAKESEVWEKEDRTNKRKKNANENAKIKLKLKRLQEEASTSVEREAEGRQLEHDMLTQQANRVNKLLRTEAQRKQKKPPTKTKPGAGAGAGGPASAAAAASDGDGDGNGVRVGRTVQLTVDDMARFKNTFELFQTIKLPEEIAGIHTVPTAAGTAGNTISAERAGIAMRYLGSNPTHAELYELIKQDSALPKGSDAGTTTDNGTDTDAEAEGAWEQPIGGAASGVTTHSIHPHPYHRLICQGDL